MSPSDAPPPPEHPRSTDTPLPDPDRPKIRDPGENPVDKLAAPPEKKGADKPEAKPEQKKDALDENAKKIVKEAQDKSKPLEQRGVEAVKKIIDTYWKDASNKPNKIVFDKDLESGLGTKNGKEKTLKVSKEFVESVQDKHFARKVIQVGHELKHFEQYAKGMSGENKKHEREYEANGWSARAQEKPGTGVMSEDMRKRYAQEALGHYKQMNSEQKERYKEDANGLTRRFGL